MPHIFTCSISLLTAGSLQLENKFVSFFEAKITYSIIQAVCSGQTQQNMHLNYCTHKRRVPDVSACPVSFHS